MLIAFDTSNKVFKLPNNEFLLQVALAHTVIETI